MRRLARSRRISVKTGWEALRDLAVFPLTRYRHTQLTINGWEMRANVTAYDVVYVALAELLAAPLITRDRRLGFAIAACIDIEVV